MFARVLAGVTTITLLAAALNITVGDGGRGGFLIAPTTGGILAEAEAVLVPEQVLGIRTGNRPDEKINPGRGRGNPWSTTTAQQSPTTSESATSTSIVVTSTTTPTTTVAPSTTTGSSSTTAPTSTTAAPPANAPEAAIVIEPGQDIQGIVRQHPAGTTFYLRAGIHRGQTVEPRNGDKFIGEPGAVLSGDDRVEFAFRSGASNVTIQGLTVEKYANPAQSGAVAGTGTGWKIIGNEIRYNWGGGVTLGDGYQVIDNYIHHNRQIGIKGGGSNILIQGNEIAYNNYRDDYSLSWEAGGTKFLKTVNLVVRDNYVHDNHGHGLWTDHDNIGTLYEGNVVVNNHGSGIFHEISYDAVIRNNRIEGNGFHHSKGGIKIGSSTNVEIYGNILKNNEGGIYVSQKARGSGSHGTFEVRNLWVHDNTIIFSQGFHGLRVEDGGDVYYTDKNNHFDRNEYNVEGSEPFFWMGDRRSVDEWRGYGLDPNGKFN